MKWSHPVLACLAAVLLASSLSACNTPSAVERDFGRSVQKAQSAQALPPNLNAPERPGTDAGIVRSSILRYEKTYVMPPSPVTGLDQSLGSANSGTPR